jgi:methyl-accepting chemotaxis protein
MNGPLKNRIRAGLGFLMILAAMLFLHLVAAPVPLADSATSLSATSPLATSPLATSSGAYAAATTGDNSLAPAPPSIYRWRHRAALGLGGLLLFGSAGLWWYMERRIFTPIEDMTGVVAAMSEGHLDQTLDTQSGTELDRLAHLINNFSVNQQEGLLFAWNQASSGLKGLQTISEHLEELRTIEPVPQPQAHAAIEAEVGRTRDLLEGIQALVRTYNFYDVCLEDQKALAATDAE